MEPCVNQGGALSAQDFAEVITFQDNLLTFDSHPHSPLLTCGTMDGCAIFYKGTQEGKDYNKLLELCLSKESCRALRFSKSGKNVFCGLKDKSIKMIDTETLKICHTFPGAHNSPIDTVHVISERLVASGDENGCVKVWDVRAKKKICSFQEHSEFISDMTDSKDHLLCTSGDGSLSVIDLRKKQLVQKSDSTESELLCITTVKGGAKVVCGDAEGVLGIFTWDLWGDTIDRYPINIRSQSIDSLIQISDSVICAGTQDGRIKVVQILPNKIICDIGQHSPDFPVDNLRLSHDKQYVWSSCYDSLKSWSVIDVPSVWVKERKREEEEEKEEESEEEVEERRKGGRKRRRKRRKNELMESFKGPKIRNTFFDDL